MKKKDKKQFPSDLIKLFGTIHTLALCLDFNTKQAKLLEFNSIQYTFYYTENSIISKVHFDLKNLLWERSD